MFKYLCTALVLLSATAMADTVKVLHVRPTNASIAVDGVVDPAWQTADSIADFYQFEPYYGQQPSQRTVAKVLTTPDALYCLMICYQPKDRIEEITALHDQDQGDEVSFSIDTFNDRQTAYRFTVCASGVAADARLLDDARNRDDSWDGVWFNAARTYDWGYVVEMKIPFRSIRYNGDAPTWGIDFQRWMPRDKEGLYWCKYEQSEGQRISKFGTLQFDGVRPTDTGMNFEVYPVALARATYLRGSKYDVNADAGIDMFYNPSEKLTFQLTANPDFAQIEADPYEFNVSRYETYFSEKRPFFTEGNEIFMASGKEQGSGFYSPLELLYTRRIGRLLPDGNEVPLQVGTKASGRIGDLQYGGFYAHTGEVEYWNEGTKSVEPGATFAAGRLKTRILDNSSIGVLFVGKKTRDGDNGVIDIDGAFRSSKWQLAYQLARSINGSSHGDYAASAGFRMFTEHWVTLIRGRAIGNQFNINEVGFVPWTGTANFITLTGPIWYFKEGTVRQFMIYGGPGFDYEHVDLYTDPYGVLGFNMQFRSNWGYEINLTYGKAKDKGIKYPYREVSYSSWFNISPRWYGNLFGSYSKTYNFSRDYLSWIWQIGVSFGWRMLDILEAGTSGGVYFEGEPAGGVADVTYNARPFLSLTPINNLNIRLYVDNLYTTSSDRLEHITAGFLFSYNFLPKSWIYLALNEVDQLDEPASGIHARMHTVNRAGVTKVKYLYYF